MHLGNLRTALIAWLAARTSGRRFLLRIEDLDTARVRAAGNLRAELHHDLQALGIDWDPPEWVQSERTEAYREAMAGLDTYECFCTRADIAQAASAPHDGVRLYPGTCARLTEREREQRRATRRPAIRVRASDDQTGRHQATVRHTITDWFAGQVSGPVDDFVLVRGDGTFAYNLAVVVDDGLAGIDQVVRGRDLLGSAPRQGWLATRLGFTQPVYAHVGLVLGPDGRRLAKRDGPTTLAQFADRGIGADQVRALLLDSVGLPELPASALAGMPALEHWGSMTRPPADRAGLPADARVAVEDLLPAGIDPQQVWERLDQDWTPPALGDQDEGGQRWGASAPG